MTFTIGCLSHRPYASESYTARSEETHGGFYFDSYEYVAPIYECFSKNQILKFPNTSLRRLDLLARLAHIFDYTHKRDVNMSNTHIG